MQNMQAMSAMRPTGKQQGFTIIELVVVILLLGILAATALPRFMDVTDEAHQAVVDALEGGIVTGATLFRAQWIGKGQPAGAVPEFGNGTLIAGTGGWPARTAGAPNGDSATCVAVYNELLQAGRPEAFALDAPFTASLPSTTTGANAAVSVGFSVDTAAIETAVTEALDNNGGPEDRPNAKIVAVMGVDNAFCLDDGLGGCVAGGDLFETQADALAGTNSLGTDATAAANAALRNGTCNYYYVGQYQTRQTGLDGTINSSGQVLGLETLAFNLGTGALTRSILAFEP